MSDTKKNKKPAKSSKTKKTTKTTVKQTAVKKTAAKKGAGDKKRSNRAQLFEGLGYIILAVLLFSVPKAMINLPNSLEGHIIIASPLSEQERGPLKMANDDPLVQSVILITHHDRRGAVGYVMNRSLENISLKDLYHKLDISPLGRSASLFSTPAYAKEFLNDELTEKMTVYWGGPLSPDETQIAFLGHKYTRRDVTKIPHTDIRFSTDMKALNKVLLFRGTEDEKPYKIIFGKAEWGAKQLYAQIEQGLWQSLPYEKDTLLTIPSKDLWHEMQKRVEKSNAEKNTETAE